MNFIANMQVADPNHPVYRAEYILTQESNRLAVTQFPMDAKLPVAETFWETTAGRTTGLFVRYFSYFWTKETTIKNHDGAESDEDIPLMRSSAPIQSPFRIETVKDSFYFVDSTSKVRSREIPKDTFIRCLCGSPQPHLDVKTVHMDTIAADGTPIFYIALVQKGEHADFIHHNFIFRALARMIGFDDRDRLVAVGKVKKVDLLDDRDTFLTPKQPIITAKRIDTAVHALVAIAGFSILAATYQTSPGARSFIATVGVASAIIKGLSRYYR